MRILTKISILILIAIFLPLTTVVSFVDESPNHPCGSGLNSSICFASIDPREKLTASERQMLNEGANLAIDTVYSAEFREELDEFRSRMERQPASVRWNLVRASWTPLSNDQIVAMLRTELNGMEVDSFGYIRGTLAWWFFGTKAKDGGSGPVLINRAALARATPNTLANTFVHEAAHRIGLLHDRPEHCRSPYAIGNIVEAIIDDETENICQFDI